jgi:diaminohydroxyphosphoribosylaminopyrimidine deaminase/5-amino-6-(5-phosphoribosylamino)uracil reductase
VTDEALMRRAMELADGVRATTSPNPWVGAIIVTTAGDCFEGATSAPGGLHAEVAALAAARAAGAELRGATVVTTLEPCSHHGRTPPCAGALLDAGVGRVVVGIEDPDPKVAGRGVGQLRAAGVDVVVGTEACAVSHQLAPYLTHRRTGRPWVVLKLAATLDGRTAAADGSSQWITSPEARADAHRLRAESDAVLVGAGTVRADDPALTVRHVEGRDPLRVVLGEPPTGARVHPCLQLSGDLAGVLDELGRREVLQLLVEGGATTAAAFHDAGLVDEYVLYLAPALMGGDDGWPLLAGAGATTLADLWRGRLVSVDRVGPDLRLVLHPVRRQPVGEGAVP